MKLFKNFCVLSQWYWCATQMRNLIFDQLHESTPKCSVFPRWGLSLSLAQVLIHAGTGASTRGSSLNLQFPPKSDDRGASMPQGRNWRPCAGMKVLLLLKCKGGMLCEVVIFNLVKIVWLKCIFKSMQLFNAFSWSILYPFLLYCDYCQTRWTSSNLIYFLNHVLSICMVCMYLI